MEQMEKVMVMVESMVMIKLRDLEKKKEKNKNGLKAKVISTGSFCFW